MATRGRSTQTMRRITGRGEPGSASVVSSSSGQAFSGATTVLLGCGTCHRRSRLRYRLVINAGRRRSQFTAPGTVRWDLFSLVSWGLASYLFVESAQSTSQTSCDEFCTGAPPFQET